VSRVLLRRRVRSPGRPGERYLLPSEPAVVNTRRHPAILMVPVLQLLGALVLVGWVTERVSTPSLLTDVLWYGWLALLARTLYQVVEWSVDRILITRKRIVATSGLFTRRVAMMPLNKVTDMTYERPLIGRLLGYGTFVMESAGQDQALHRVAYLPSPDQLYLKVSDLLFGPPGEPAELPATEPFWT